MKVLKSKYITTQGEFNTWIAQRGNEAYTYVYLKGTFTANSTIKLNDIGTKEVTGVEYANINVIIDSDSSAVEAGIDGDNNAAVFSISLSVSGRSTEENRVIGFEQCVCNNCSATVSATNKYDKYDGSKGVSACGFLNCSIHWCSVLVYGGTGHTGVKGEDGSAFSHDAKSGGGPGGKGGDAIDFLGCTLKSVNSAQIFGGTGGDGGAGGDGYVNGFNFIYNNTIGGNGGNGGDGGDCYVYSSSFGNYNCYKGMGGTGGAPGATGSNQKGKVHSGDVGHMGTNYLL